MTETVDVLCHRCRCTVSEPAGPDVTARTVAMNHALDVHRITLLLAPVGAPQPSFVDLDAPYAGPLDPFPSLPRR